MDEIGKYILSIGLAALITGRHVRGPALQCAIIVCAIENAALRMLIFAALKSLEKMITY